MAETITKHERNLSALIHGATLGRFFFPLGQFLFPLLFWLPNRKQYAFVDYHGKQALNFQISMTLYALVIGMISFPFFLGLLPNIFDGGIIEWAHGNHRGPFHYGFMDNFWNSPRFWLPLGLTGFLELVLYAVNIIYTILATLRTNEGAYFKYPLTIPFIK
ncbi:DUF4870 domain-containing protein [Robiginitalea aurantiaca]|uniref:DUF4870 domain-containing protein n=1 Tax=Robiginitalea aurantiaca TaxID=3056915 RepID=A0ABT7WCK8_9FLAO|nr:DUF4870 domain-containing protein [Robiginitalea aurantiaca]MDM9630646.1 DUF4870 domain-containing protein [Robiginitalea aurantiaca]